MKNLCDSAGELRARALRLLARREHSRAELARKLAAHAESRPALEVLLDELASKDQLSDERYAEERVRQLSRKYGLARIRNELKAKGVGGGLAGRISCDDEFERARRILLRKYRSPGATREDRAKRARFLRSRGFSYETIRRLLRMDMDESRIDA